MAGVERTVTGKTPLFETIKAPVLEGISPRLILKFIDERERYKKAIESRNEEPGVK